MPPWLADGCRCARRRPETGSPSWWKARHNATRYGENVDNLYRQGRQDPRIPFGQRRSAAAAEATGRLDQQLQLSHHPDCGSERKGRDPPGAEWTALGFTVALGLLTV